MKWYTTAALLELVMNDLARLCRILCFICFFSFFITDLLCCCFWNDHSKRMTKTTYTNKNMRLKHHTPYGDLAVTNSVICWLLKCTDSFHFGIFLLNFYCVDFYFDNVIFPFVVTLILNNLIKIQLKIQFLRKKCNFN